MIKPSLKTIVFIVIVFICISQLNVKTTAESNTYDPTTVVPMNIWEAYAKEYITISSYGAYFNVTNTGLVPVIIDEYAMLLNPHPLDNSSSIKTTQDGALTYRIIAPGESFSYLYGYLTTLPQYQDLTPWWCTENNEYATAYVEITLGGEILPKTLIELIDIDYNRTTQNLIWRYQNDNPTLVVGKTPLWTELILPGAREFEITLTVTNIGFINATGVSVIDIIPEGYTASDYEPKPSRILENYDGTTTIVWNIDLEQGSRTDIHNATIWHSTGLHYKLTTPPLMSGRYYLPRAKVDVEGDGDEDAWSAKPLLEVGNTINNAISLKESTLLPYVYELGEQSLIIKIEHVDRHIEKALDWYQVGRFHNAYNELNAAKNVLGAFVNEVNAQCDKNKLSDKDAKIMLEDTTEIFEYIELSMNNLDV